MNRLNTIQTAAYAGDNAFIKENQNLIHEAFQITPLHLAVLGNHLDTAELLLNLGDNRPSKDTLGNTVFHAMASGGYTQLLTRLLSIDIKGPFYHNNFIQYPIHSAILTNQAEIVKLLLAIDKVATLDDSQKRVALHYAAMYGSPEIVKLCCDATHDLNVRDTEGKTPLALAIEAENDGASEELIARGAKVAASKFNP